MTGRPSSGFALPVTLFALMVIGLMVTAAFFTSRQEVRIGQSTERTATAFYSTERAINQVLSSWQQSNYAWMDQWEDTTFSDTVDHVSYTIQITRLNDLLYFADATGTLIAGNLLAGASRRVGMLVRLRTADMDPPAALTAQGPIQIGGSSKINGRDSIPPRWDTTTCGATTNKPGVLSDDTTQISYSGRSYRIFGDPRLVQDTTMDESLFSDFGDVTWDELVAMAEKTYPDNTTITRTAADSVFSGGSYQCRTSTLNNWGAPRTPGSVCHYYYPLIYAAGNLRLSSSSSGQGILLVEGDLDVTGGFSFYGVVVVKGRLKTTGTGGHFYGGVMAENVDFETSQVLGNALVQYSSCAIQRAILYNSAITRARPLAARSWIDLSSLMY